MHIWAKTAKPCPFFSFLYEIQLRIDWARSEVHSCNGSAPNSCFVKVTKCMSSRASEKYTSDFCACGHTCWAILPVRFTAHASGKYACEFCACGRTCRAILAVRFTARVRKSPDQACICNNLDNKIFTCGVFLDLEKPFDHKWFVINHKILLRKSSYYGIYVKDNNKYTKWYMFPLLNINCRVILDLY